MDAKKALTETGGDFGQGSADYLREQGIAQDGEARRSHTGRRCRRRLPAQPELGRPVIGVLVGLASETDFVAKSDEFIQTANDIAMHAAAANPSWVNREDVPEEVISKEKELIAAQARNEGKPDEIVEKIVEGRIGSFYKDHVLLDQVYVRTDRFEGTVGELVQQLAAKMGENISVASMARVEIGES